MAKKILMAFLCVGLFSYQCYGYGISDKIEITGEISEGAVQALIDSGSIGSDQVFGSFEELNSALNQTESVETASAVEIDGFFVVCGLAVLALTCLSLVKKPPKK
ncbi:MAG: hypothetical protein GW917_00110 [Bdellovibrionales bacterium]|nr:hypothetical protein [Bdellovibrionales bacterium]